MADLLFIREQHGNPGVCILTTNTSEIGKKCKVISNPDLFQCEAFCVLQAFTNVTLLAHGGDF